MSTSNHYENAEAELGNILASEAGWKFYAVGAIVYALLAIATELRAIANK